VLEEATGGKPERVLVATGSEVWVALASRDLLEAEGLPTRVVNLPSWFLFEKQDASYRSEVLPKSVPAISIEAGSTFGWSRYADASVGLDRFGASAPAETLFREFGFTPEDVARVAKELRG
jgi:transketolase